MPKRKVGSRSAVVVRSAIAVPDTEERSGLALVLGEDGDTVYSRGVRQTDSPTSKAGANMPGSRTDERQEGGTVTDGNTDTVERESQGR